MKKITYIFSDVLDYSAIYVDNKLVAQESQMDPSAWLEAIRLAGGEAEEGEIELDDDMCEFPEELA